MDLAVLRKRALAALGSFGDDRARRALEEGTITLAPIARRWGGTDGEVSAYVVLLGLDGASLGALRGKPHVEDEVTAALAAALAESPRQTLDAVRPYWAFEEHQASPYRGIARVDVDRTDGKVVLLAARAYLIGKGEEQIANVLREVKPTRDGSIWRVLVSLGFCEHRATQLVEACIADLLTGAAGDQVLVDTEPE